MADDSARGMAVQIVEPRPASVLDANGADDDRPRISKVAGHHLLGPVGVHHLVVIEEAQRKVWLASVDDGVAWARVASNRLDEVLDRHWQLRDAHEKKALEKQARLAEENRELAMMAAEVEAIIIMGLATPGIKLPLTPSRV
jgi:hypothetical protein